MNQDQPNCHQQLLEAHCRARIGIICEHSADIKGDVWQLRQWANTYARRQQLDAPPGEIWEDYLFCECGRPFHECATFDGAEEHGDRT